MLAPTDDAADVGRIIVTDSGGGTARSADFDRYIRTAPSPTLSFTPENGVNWSLPPDTSDDTTPGDPLDPGASRTTCYLELRLNEPPYDLSNCRQVYLNSTYPGALSGVIDNRGNKPFSITMRSSNAWQAVRHGGSAEVGVAGQKHQRRLLVRRQQHPIQVEGRVQLQPEEHHRTRVPRGGAEHNQGGHPELRYRHRAEVDQGNDPGEVRQVHHAGDQLRAEVERVPAGGPSGRHCSSAPRTAAGMA